MLSSCLPRRGGREVEGSGLENRQRGDSFVGSNPTPSASARRCPGPSPPCADRLKSGCPAHPARVRGHQRSNRRPARTCARAGCALHGAHPALVVPGPPPRAATREASARSRSRSSYFWKTTSPSTIAIITPFGHLEAEFRIPVQFEDVLQVKDGEICGLADLDATAPVLVPCVVGARGSHRREGIRDADCLVLRSVLACAVGVAGDLDFASAWHRC